MLLKSREIGAYTALPIMELHRFYLEIDHSAVCAEKNKAGTLIHPYMLPNQLIESETNPFIVVLCSHNSS